jgi:GDP-L-fucose synthase
MVYSNKSINWTKKNVLVTGGNGFLGFYVVKELQKRGAKNIVTPSSEDCDLRINSNCKKIVKDIDIVFHLAATVGGIALMKAKPADVFYDNLMMGTQIIHESKKAGVEKVIALGTVCSYPKFASLPFSENNIWDGYPEETNASYGLAKKMLIVQSQAYRQQYDFKSIVLVPTNLYGPRDNFDPVVSHVIPALILKIYNAKKANSDTITMWGDGSPTRDFLYVEDAARGTLLAAERYDNFTPLNLGSEEEISIKDLVNMISTLMNFDGAIKWDTSKPNGQPRRCVSNKRAEEKIGFKPQVKLKDGLKNTIDWFVGQQESKMLH